MEILIAFLLANPELVSAAVTAIASLVVALSKRFGGERFHLMKQLGRAIAVAPKS